MDDLRQVEDFLIEMIDLDLLRGRLNQKNRSFKVLSSRARDVRPEETPLILSGIDEWYPSNQNLEFTGY